MSECLNRIKVISPGDQESPFDAWSVGGSCAIALVVHIRFDHVLLISRGFKTSKGHAIQLSFIAKWYVYVAVTNMNKPTHI